MAKTLEEYIQEQGGYQNFSPERMKVVKAQFEKEEHKYQIPHYTKQLANILKKAKDRLSPEMYGELIEEFVKMLK